MSQAMAMERKIQTTTAAVPMAAFAPTDMPLVAVAWGVGVWKPTGSLVPLADGERESGVDAVLGELLPLVAIGA